MTSYRTVAKFRNEHEAFHDIMEALNEDLDDSEFSILNIIGGSSYVVKEDDDGDIEVVGELSDDDAMDYWGDTDELARDLDGSNYYVGEFPFGDRQIFSFLE